MNSQHIIELKEERLLKLFGCLQRMRSNRSAKMIFEWNAEDRRRKVKPRG